MLTVQARNRGRPPAKMLRQAYVEGVVAGLKAATGVVDTAKQLATFTISKILTGKQAQDALDAIDGAFRWAMEQAEKSPALGDVTPEELAEARANIESLQQRAAK